MIQDLHSHTYYSFDSTDKIEAVIQTAIDGGIELLGITDHNYGIGNARMDIFHDRSLHQTDYERLLTRYRDHVLTVMQNYKDKIKLISGIEICTAPTLKNTELPSAVDVSTFDYCLIENLDFPGSITQGNLFKFAKRCGTPTVGVAHTDLFGFCQKNKLDTTDFFKKMADQNIFWEMNVNYDSLHGYREHAYVKDFFADQRKQDIVRNTGVMLSVGFDGHKTEEYLPDRVKSANKKIRELKIPLVFDKENI